MDNSVVTTISSCTGPYALYKVEKYSRKESRKVKFSYNQAMGGVNLLDSSVETYGPCIQGKKWWSHFIDSLGVLVAPAWRIHHTYNPQEDQSLTEN